MRPRRPPALRWHGAGDASYRSAIAYDSIYDALTPGERPELAGRLVANGVLRMLDDRVLGDKRFHSLDTIGHNWWNAIVFSAGVVAMAALDGDTYSLEWGGIIFRAGIIFPLLNNNPRSAPIHNPRAIPHPKTPPSLNLRSRAW